MSDKFVKLLIIPTDNRPVSYDLPFSIAKLIKNSQITIVPKDYLSSLNNDVNYEGLIGWLKDILSKEVFDIIVVSLDTIAYGGLIPSRRTSLKFDDIKKRIDEFADLIKNLNQKPKIYAFSSIMRISNSDINEEEKSYWDNYGKMIYEFSYLSHKMLAQYDEFAEKTLAEHVKEIPFEIIDDYLNSRRRNFEINMSYLDLVKENVFDYMIYGKDDTAEFGFNVEEAELIDAQIKKENLVEKAFVKTGADELTTNLVARAIGEFYCKNVTFQIKFFKKGVEKIVSKYEGFSIKESVLSQLDTCNCDINTNNFDVSLLINAPNKVQDELCLNIFEDENDNSQVDNLIDYMNLNNYKFAVADIKNANGADNYLVQKLCDKNLFNKLYSFGAWNTTSNTLGTVISVAKVKFIAETLNLLDETEFKKIMLIRFLDDWAYQANVRQIIRKENNNDILYQEMNMYCENLKELLGLNVDLDYKFPWHRTFEIEIVIK